MKTIATTNASAEILRRGYVRQLAPDEAGGYVASIMEFPGCVAEGDSADEALKNLDSAAESWIEVAMANGQHIRDPIDFEGCSGKLALRMPRSLHKQAASLAELEGCSLNQFIVTALSHYVGGMQFATNLERISNLLPRPSFDIRQISVHFFATSATSIGKRVIDAPILEKASTASLEIWPALAYQSQR